MSKNPFKTTPPVEDVKRNSFDLSFNNNLTLKIGKLTPVMCKEVVPGDSFEIDASFGLRFMPTVFPVQNRIRADLHFFYVRNRNLWKNWQDFYGNTWTKSTPLVSPYIGAKSADSDFFNEGSLSDYLGVPTNAVSSIGGARYTPIRSYLPSSQPISDLPTAKNWLNGLRYLRLPTVMRSKSIAYQFPFSEPFVSYSAPNPERICVIDSSYMLHTLDKSQLKKMSLVVDDTAINLPSDLIFHVSFLTYKNGAFYNQGTLTQTQRLAANPKVFTPQGIKEFDDFQASIDPEKTVLALNCYSASSGFQDIFNYLNTNLTSKETIDLSGIKILAYYSGYNYSVPNSDDTSNVVAETFNPNYIAISALPYRCYESIYNSFYRNERIDPLLDEDGDPVYNKFLINNGDGADNYPYKLYNRYWENDFLTTALLSPQMGPAPLVGLSQNQPFVNQKMTLNNTEQTVTVKTDPANNNVIGISYYSDNLPVGSIDALNEAISYGISINDFRNVNALQRWLEKSQLRGYKYKDQLLSHFGVNVTFEELDMPEFIGGISQNIDSNVITNQAASADYKLGEFAGTLSGIGKGNNKIRKYCDEPGFIMAILSISPIPTYSQLLPKMFLKNHRLDYYFPEFGHIGLQPITKKEVSPLQVYQFAKNDKDATFGYQRAFYDYVQSTDEVHGAMRTSLRNYLINREFADVPELSKQFIEISPEEVNDVFSVEEDTDKVVGQVSFNIIAKRPIPFFGTPTL